MKALLSMAIMAMMISGPLAWAHGGGGGGFHGGSGGGSHGSWGGGGSSHGGFHGGTISHGHGGGGSFLHGSAGIGRGFHHGWSYGWWPWLGGWGWYDGLDYCVPTAVVSPTVVAPAPEVGQQYTSDGLPYYSSNGVTYVQTADGSFQPVYSPQATAGIVPSAGVQPQAAGSVPAPPVVAVPAQLRATGQPGANASNSQGKTTQPDEVFTIYIAKSKGGYAPITLRRSGSGFIGPQDEYYPDFPKIDLLKAMYGK